MSKNKNVAVHCDVLYVRLLFTAILLKLVQQKNVVNDSSMSDSYKMSFFQYHHKAIQYLDQLHHELLPFDSELGSIDLKEGNLKPEYNGNVEPGQSI